MARPTSVVEGVSPVKAKETQSAWLSLPRKHSEFALCLKLVRCPFMQRVATEQSAAPAILTPSKTWSARAIAAFAALAALWFVLCRQLSGEWSINEQYNYGWFVPFFCAYLFWLRWEDRPEPEGRGQRSEGRGQPPAGEAYAPVGGQ